MCTPIVDNDGELHKSNIDWTPTQREPKIIKEGGVFIFGDPYVFNHIIPHLNFSNIQNGQVEQNRYKGAFKSLAIPETSDLRILKPNCGLGVHFILFYDEQEI